MTTATKSKTPPTRRNSDGGVGLTSFPSGTPPGDPHRVTGWEVVLRSRQADGPDVVGVGDRAVQLHQGDVIVEGVGVVVGVRDDLLQVLLHRGTPGLLLQVEAHVRLPGAGLRVSEDTNHRDHFLKTQII